MIITDRDLRILEDLQKYGLMKTRWIAARHFQSVAKTTILRRLRLLAANRYILRLTGLDDGQHAWALTDQSAKIFLPSASKLHFPKFILDHDLALASLRLKLEEVGIAQSWRPEHEIRQKVARAHGLKRSAGLVIPDGLMGVEIKGFKESVAIELELSNKNQRRYRTILTEYRRKENLWGVWYVVGQKTLARQLLTAHGNGAYRGPYLLWSTLEDVMTDPLNAKVYGPENKFRLGDLWATKPAQPRTQGVSRPSE
jgi:hypothetical protein